jgi:hypothetical protein
MPLQGKRNRHLKKARAARQCEQKKQCQAILSNDKTDQEAIDEEATSEMQEVEPEASIPAAVHWAGVDDGDSDQEEDDCELTETKEDAFAMMMRRAKKGGAAAFEATNFKYQRGPELNNKQKKRKRDAAQQLDEAAMDCRPLNKGFLKKSSSSEAKPPQPKPNC